MEECEALCDRVAIMVNGQFQCLGGIQHLKKKFGQGFAILMKLGTRGLATEYTEEVLARTKEALISSFNQCTVKDEHKDYLHFHIGDPKTPWHVLFETMEEIKAKIPEIEDYSVSETTLEQVFLSFAKKQRPEEAPESYREDPSTTFTHQISKASEEVVFSSVQN